MAPGEQPRDRPAPRDPPDAAAVGAALPTEAEVDELRARLDGIRAMLDDADRRDPVGAVRPPAPGRSWGRSWRRPARRRVLVALGAGVVVALLLVGHRVVPTDGTSPSRRPATATGTASGTASGSVPGSPVDPGRSAVPPVPPAPAGSARAVPSAPAAGGPGIDAPGTDVVLAPAADRPGVLDVYERVVPADRSAAVLRLTAPDPTRWTGVTVRADVSVTAFEATSGGRPAVVRAVPGGWEVADARGGPLGPVVLRYQVTGATVLTPGANPGRMLVLLWPLSAEASQAAGAPVVVRPDRGAVTVRQMLCPLAEPALQLCGAAAPDGWTGRIPAGAAAPLVVVQADRRTR